MSLLSPPGGKPVVLRDDTPFNADWFGHKNSQYIVCGESHAVDWTDEGDKVVVDTTGRFQEYAGNWIKHFGTHYRLASFANNSVRGSHLYRGERDDKIDRRFLEQGQKNVAFGEVIPWLAGHKDQASSGGRQKYMQEFRRAIDPRLASPRSQLCMAIEREWFSCQLSRYPNARIIIVAHIGGWRRLHERGQLKGENCLFGESFCIEVDKKRMWLACKAVGAFGSPYNTLSEAIEEARPYLPSP